MAPATAFENIKNLKVKNIYKILAFKSINLQERQGYVSKCEFLFKEAPYDSLYQTTKTPWGASVTALNISWQNLVDFIKEHHKNDEDVKTLFEKVFQLEVQNTILESLACDFVKDLKLNITW